MKNDKTDGSTPPDSGVPDFPLEFLIPEKKEGIRLDAAMSEAFPLLGLRARRRLWEWCLIRVNGREARPGIMVNAGDRVSIVPRGEARYASRSCAVQGDYTISSPLPTAARATQAGESFHCEQSEGGLPRLPTAIRFIAANDKFIALYKPAGLHSAHISGSAASSLEDYLRTGWPQLYELWQQQLNPDRVPGNTRRPEPPPRLLTRLDRPTSGIVLAARHREAAELFRILEQEGKVQKTYFALVDGVLAEPLWLTKRLDTDNRATSKVLEQEEEDFTRHTLAAPLQVFSVGQPFPGMLCKEGFVDGRTLVKVEIQRGARHQIRAHLAAAGFPLAWDPVYNPHCSANHPENSTLFLHHARIVMPGFEASILPEWEWLEAIS